MSTKITRRNFLKLSGVGAAAATVLTGCGPMSRYVRRSPYNEMPEFSKVGESTYYATTCRECPAACGIIMRTMEGRAIKAEGNPNHPVSRGKICPRGLTAVQGLYNPDRVTGPIRRQARGSADAQNISWEDAVNAVAQGLGNGGQAVFLLGLAPDHLFDLASELAEATGAPAPLRYSAVGAIEGRSTLLAATQAVFGQAALPFFDIANSDLVISFGGDFLYQGLSPVSYGRAFGTFRRFGALKQRGYLISIEPRMSPTSGAADEWIAVTPGSEGLVAQAIASLAGNGGNALNLSIIAQASGVSEQQLRHLGDLFARAQAPVAVPGGGALTHANGLETAQAILNLNAARMNQPGGMFLAGGEQQAAASSMEDMQQLVQAMQNGQVQTLFIHGVNPIFELPPALGFAEALRNVNTVISFATYPDETALQSDYVLPDHSALESFGYQGGSAGTSGDLVSAMQPVVAPLYNTRATADVLLAAARQAGSGLNYNDEVEYIQQRLVGLLGQGGSIDAEAVEPFWARFLQFGGWWREAGQTGQNGEEGEEGENGTAQAPARRAGQIQPMVRRENENSFYLLPFATHLGAEGANRPWLQETPEPMTTVTWHTWVEINPETAKKLDIHHDDVVRVRSSVGEIELSAYMYPGIRPDTVAIPFGQGHTALGRYAEGRGANPLALVEVNLNGAGELTLGDTLVTIEKTGRRRPLARLESIVGVYGEH
jgi:anaerobic selenocysteine-containing dehydrogenase